MSDFRADQSFAAKLDAEDPLAGFRDRFHLPRSRDGKNLLYLCGNSLGLMPRSTRAYVEDELEAWAALAVDAHFAAKHPWVSYHENVTGPLARLAGAEPGEVVAMNSLTVNLHLLMASFYQPSPERHRVVMEAHAFPSDQYAVQSQVRFHGYAPDSAIVELRPRTGEHTLRSEDIEEFFEREGKAVALVLLGGVSYYTGQAFDMKRVAGAARRQGCVVGFDLAHAIGNLPLQLHDWGADFAVWCSYKYLNAGPGSTAGCFVHARHARRFELPRLAGWWGHSKSKRFQMAPTFEPIEGAEGWQVSNPAIFSLAALRASLDIFDEAGMTHLRAKSILLTSYLEFLLRPHTKLGFTVLTPSEAEQRGAQLSIYAPFRGRELFDSLTRSGVVCDWREPGVIRVAPVPLYNTFTEVYDFVDAFRRAFGAG